MVRILFQSVGLLAALSFNHSSTQLPINAWTIPNLHCNRIGLQRAYPSSYELDNGYQPKNRVPPLLDGPLRQFHSKLEDVTVKLD
ncbi:hypothetical protein L0152_19180 [bacterium]|nr:hypothetical protein [bacterium]